MKLKFINLLLASTLLVGAAQVFTSCKDNENDLWADLDTSIGQLGTRVGDCEDQLKDLTDPVTGVQAQINNLNKEKEQLDKDLRDLNSDLGGKITALEGSLSSTGATGTAIQNLKDEIANLKNEIDNKVVDLSGIETDIRNLKDALNGLNGVKDDITALKTRLGVAEGSIEGLRNDLLKTNSDVSEVKGDITTINNTLTNLNSQLLNTQITLNNLNTLIDGNTTRIEALETFRNTWVTQLPDIAKNAADALALANDNVNRIQALEALQDSYATKTELTAVKEAIGTQINDINTALAGKVNTSDLATELAQLRTEAAANLQAAKDYADAQLLVAQAYTDTQMQEAKDYADSLVAGLEQKINANTAAINAVNAAIASVQQSIKDLEARLSGIVVHQAVCPFFGTFNLPVGVANKMLVAYVGELDHPVDFPAVEGETPLYESKGYITVDEMRRLGLELETEKGKIADRGSNGEIALGSAYITLNPNNVNYKNYTYKVVNSRGEDTKINLTVTPSDRELTLGYGRSEANGFYNASATVTNANESALRFSLSESFKTDVKDVLKNVRANANVKTVAKLAGMAVKEVNGVLPALAIQASWNESTGANSVNSEYNLGVTTVTPLSFSLVSKLDGKFPEIADRIMNRIPDIGSIPEKFNTFFDELTGNIKINILPEGYEFNIDHIKIDLSDVSVSIKIDDLDINVTNPEIDVQVPKYDLTIEATVYDTDGAEIGTAVVNKELVFDPVHVEVPIQESIDEMTSQMTSQLSGMLNDALNEEFDKLLQNLGGQMEDELNKAMQKVSDSVNDLFSDMNNNINDQIEDILADIQQEISDKIESVTDRLSGLSDKFESLLQRVDKVLSHPLHYVEPVLFYKNGSKIGIMSANAGSPTLMTLNGGNAVTLLATTYTLETAVPCYKKYVAAVNAYRNGDSSKTPVTSVINKVNKQTVSGKPVFNTPISGARFTLPLILQAGYTYELVYQAMDYSGNVMGRRFYICVK